MRRRASAWAIAAAVLGSGWWVISRTLGFASLPALVLAIAFAAVLGIIVARVAR